MNLLREELRRQKTLMLIKESQEGFKRSAAYILYDKDHNYIGEVTNTHDAEGSFSGDRWEYLDNASELAETASFQAFAAANNITADSIGRIVRERIATIDGRPLEKAYYKPSDSEEWFDEKTHTFYNMSGQRLRSPREYEPDEHGTYEPMGDEGSPYDD